MQLKYVFQVLFLSYQEAILWKQNRRILFQYCENDGEIRKLSDIWKEECEILKLFPAVCSSFSSGKALKKLQSGKHFQKSF